MVCYNLGMGERGLSKKAARALGAGPWPNNSDEQPIGIDGVHRIPRRERRNKIKPPVVVSAIFPDAEAQTEPSDAGVQEGTRREIEHYTLYKGTPREEIVWGKSYTIGMRHPLIEVWNSPPDTWGARRLDSINGCRVLIIEQGKYPPGEEPETYVRGWERALVFRGVHKITDRSTPIRFDASSGDARVSVEWKQIRVK